MLKKSVGVIVLCALLGACISEPRDPAFAGSDAINPQAAAQNRISLGLTYLSNGNFSAAKANLDKALNFMPKSADAHFAMAYYYQQVDELELAEEYYANALKYAPENPDIINSYGAFLCEQGKYEKAKSYFLKAATNKSYVSTAETYENLAICALDQGKTEEALGFFESALNHQPTRGKSLFLVAQLQMQQGNFGEAKKTLWKYDRVARVSPESLWLSYEIAQGLGDTKSALGYGELMKSMFPEHPNTALFKKQMGKFQPVATVTNKRKPNSSAEQTSVSESAVQSPQTTPETDTANQPSLVKVNKKVKTLAPPTNNTVSTEGMKNESQAAVIKAENESAGDAAETATTSTATPTEQQDTTNTTGGRANSTELSAAEIAKREAELEAALVADFNMKAKDDAENKLDDSQASIEGKVEKVNNSLAKADEVVQEQVTTKTQEVAESIDEKPNYHVVLPKENLYRISLRYNVKVKTLMQWNNLDDPSSITIGMKLRVKDPKYND